MCIPSNSPPPDNSHQNTLNRIHQNPPCSDISWSDIIDLLNAIGVVREYDDRVFVLVQRNPERKCGVIHCRERQGNASQSTIRDLQDFLIDIDEIEP